MGRRKGQIAAMSNCQLVKDRHKRSNHRRGDNDSFLHTTEMNDGTEYNRINFQSVTEQNNLEDFLITAEMAGRDFTAERQNITVISDPGRGLTLTPSDLAAIAQAQDSHRHLLQVPRRPDWDETTTKEELILRERESFTDWRRKLKVLDESEHIQMTPYEKNLDFWRQLWRVIERSDVIVQIVDARNPLLFRCTDLEAYVKEINDKKQCMLLINKADYLTEQQRKIWVEFFDKEKITIVFFSALLEKEKQEMQSRMESVEEGEEGDVYDSEHDSEEEEIDEEDDDDAHQESLKEAQQSAVTEKESVVDNDNTTVNSLSSELDNLSTNQEDRHSPIESSNNCSNCVKNTTKIVTSDELLEIFRTMAVTGVMKGNQEVKTIGMVGYPNVGKSSTINVILEQKKLAVSATPGRTKHLQTLHVDAGLVLCDCPGLVFPSFVATKAHLVINGILPIDELRDHTPPVQLVCESIPRAVLEGTYSIMIPRPSRDEDDDRPPTAEEFLTAYGGMRGFMTPRGVDCPRAARYVLKDFVKGKLLYCEPPPGHKGCDFQDPGIAERLAQTARVTKMPIPQIKSDIDAEFFVKRDSKAGSRGVQGVHDFVRTDTLQHSGRADSLAGSVAGSLAGSTASLASQVSSVGGSKPWKKHNNRNKKEKLRRLHRDLDLH